MGMDVGGRKGGAMATPNVGAAHRYSLVLIIIFNGYYAAYAEGLGHARSSALAEPASKSWNSRTSRRRAGEKNGKLKINNEEPPGKV